MFYVVVGAVLLLAAILCALIQPLLGQCKQECTDEMQRIELLF